MGDHRKSFEAPLKVLKLGGNLHARLREASRRARRIVGAGPEQRRAAEAQLEAEEKEPTDWSGPERYDRTDAAIGRCDIEYLVNGEGSKCDLDYDLVNQWSEVVKDVMGIVEDPRLKPFFQREALDLREFLAGCIFTEHEGGEWKLFVDYLFGRRRSRPRPFIILEAEYEKLPLELRDGFRLQPNRIYLDVTTGHIDDIADVIRKWRKRSRASYETLMKPGGEFVPGARMYPGVNVQPAGKPGAQRGRPSKSGQAEWFLEAAEKLRDDPTSQECLFAEYLRERQKTEPETTPKEARRNFHRRIKYAEKRLDPS